MSDQLRLRGTLKGHGGWVTQIATTPSVPDMILSASRGTHSTHMYHRVRGRGLNFITVYTFTCMQERGSGIVGGETVCLVCACLQGVQ